MASILPSETQAAESLRHQLLRYAPVVAAAIAAIGIVLGFWETVLSIVGFAMAALLYTFVR